MRGIGKHTPPAEMQREPADNTSDAVMTQVRAWRDRPYVSRRTGFHPAGLLIHTESAREIAAWWQTPSNMLAVFAGTGEIDPSLPADIASEIQSYASEHEHVGMGAQERKENQTVLRALLAYVNACPKG